MHDCSAVSRELQAKETERKKDISKLEKWQGSCKNNTEAQDYIEDQQCN
jgi:hypothetical protein